MKSLLLLTLLLVASPTRAQTHCPCPPKPNDLTSYSKTIKNLLLPDLIEVRKVSYPRNPKASFCTRPADMIDTIVLHHSETPTTTTAEGINTFHLNRGTAADPWYMIAYGYVINSPYQGSSIPKPLVSEGRPMEIVGAHAGSNVFVDMDEVQKKIWDDKQILCMKEGQEAKLDPTLVKDGKIKANVTTLGIVINGNYAPYHRRFNPGGYPANKPRNPSKSTQEMIARLSCQLQRQHPRIKYIKWHRFYTNTSCPGTIEKYINDIKILAKGYGCEFQ